MDWDADTATQVIRRLAEQIQDEVDQVLASPLEVPQQLVRDVLEQPQQV